MCNKQQIKRKIAELEEIKTFYTRFINDYSTQKCVENITWATKNKHIIKKILHDLYVKLYKNEEKEQKKTNDKLKKQAKTDEISAILHFNKDKRFTITE